MVITNTFPPPPPILPKNIKKLKFLDIDPLEIARQLTIIESKLYNKIQPVECLNKAWGKVEGDGDGDGDVVAANIKAMISNSNKVKFSIIQLDIMYIFYLINQIKVKRNIYIYIFFIR